MILSNTELITGGHTALASCFILSVLDTGNIKSSGKPINRLISNKPMCRRSFVKTGIIAPPPLLLTANVGNCPSKEYALIPLERICNIQSVNSQSDAMRSSDLRVFGGVNDKSLTFFWFVYNQYTRSIFPK